MLISLSEVMNEKAAVRKLTVQIELTDFMYQGRTYDFIDKKPLELTLSNIGNRKVFLKAESKVVLKVPCDRCLADTAVPIGIDVEKELDFSKSEEDLSKELNEIAYINDYHIHVDEFICEEILMGMPMKVLCKEDCKGICNECGADLNASECECCHAEPYTKMSVIRDIFNKANSSD